MRYTLHASLFMSGHNKWSQIKRKKGATDAQKSKVFSKFSRLITLESKKSGGNVNDFGLKAIIDQAKSFNMPKENIERAIKKGAGADSPNIQSIIYEGYGPSGVAIIVEILTENRNKTSAEIKHILSKHGGNLGAPGSASWAFKKIDGEWVPNEPLEISDESVQSLLALINELEDNDDVQDVFTNALFPKNLE